VKRFFGSLLVLLVLGLATAWWLARPQPLAANPLPAHQANLANGERMFNAGGCASCHGSVENGKPVRERLGGGLQLPTPVGVFHVPNISAHPVDGIGGWSSLQFLNAMQRGLSPGGQHYYPAFPYTSYARMYAADVLDLQAYLLSLPAVAGTAPAHELRWPFSFRPALGLWKRLFLDEAAVMALPGADTLVQKGRYLVEGPGHCGECHTPRNLAQAMSNSQWLEGAVNPGGDGNVPSLRDGLGDWSPRDIIYYLETGVDPDFDVVGGDMAAVQGNMSRLPAADREAMAAYLKALP
jgi:mono/diheme cytochrome c family protein